jgi:hypothetical protein
MHGLQGWSPPATGMRRFGLRTRAEIDAERYALKLLRGDFDTSLKSPGEADKDAAGDLWRAVRA